MVHNRTNDVAGESRLLKLSRTKEIASQDDRVIGVTSELEAAGDSMGNSSLSGPGVTEEPVDFGLSDEVFLAHVTMSSNIPTRVPGVQT